VFCGVEAFRLCRNSMERKPYSADLTDHQWQAGWVEAGSLGIGTSIVTRAGPTLAVKSLDWKRLAQTKPGLAPGLTTPAFTVYNFTVDDPNCHP